MCHSLPDLQPHCQIFLKNVDSTSLNLYTNVVVCVKRVLKLPLVSDSLISLLIIYKCIYFLCVFDNYSQAFTHLSGE